MPAEPRVGEFGGYVFIAKLKGHAILGTLLLVPWWTLYLIHDVTVSNYDLNLAFSVILHQPGVVLSVPLGFLLDF